MSDLKQKFLSFLKSNQAFIGLFLLASVIVYFEVLFLHYGISSNEASLASGSSFGKLFPILDPVAGSLQDHPWLHKIGMSLRQGAIPLINLQNGLGALLVESLQSGVFYPLNLLLVGMDLSSPQFFDIFQILHITILSLNCFLLFKLYIRWELALVMAAAFALSPLTFLEINMVHYRGFVWTPLMAWAAVNMARSKYSISKVFVLTGATICCVTAGNPQETFFNILAVLIFFAAESFTEKPLRWKPVAVFLLSLCGGILIAAPAVLPYFMSKNQGLLSSLESATRSSYAISPPWLLNWIVPHINGPYTIFYRGWISSPDEYAVFPLHPLFIFLVIAGVLALFLNPTIKLKHKAIFSIFLGAGLLGILNTASFNPFQPIIAQIPFINTLRFPKYINYIHLLIATSAVISLSWLIATPLKMRRRITASALGVCIVLVIAIVLFQISDPAWKFHSKRLDQLIICWVGCVLAIGAFAYFLMRKTQGELIGKPLLIIVIIAGLAIKPFGFSASTQQYPPFPVSGLDFAKERLVSDADAANTNLLTGYERIELFDPIFNRSFGELMLKNLPIVNGFMHLQMPKGTVINDKQISLLRLMGVTAIYGYEIADSDQILPVNQSFARIKDPLPQIFLLNSTNPIEASCQQQDYGKVLELIQAALISRPVAGVQKGVNDLRFILDRPGQGTLISLQAFSPGWELTGQPATKFCNIFNSWKGTFAANQPYQITYTPPGLRKSYTFVFAGILLVLGAIALSFRMRRSRPEN